MTQDPISRASRKDAQGPVTAKGLSGFLETIPAHVSLKQKILDANHHFIPFGGKLILV